MLKVITITLLISIATAELPYEHSCDYLKGKGNFLGRFDVEKVK